jgi:adenylate cyclase class IV
MRLQVGHKNREIEIKLMIEDSYSNVVKFVKGLHYYEQEIIGRAADLYWLPPNNETKVNFVRLRKNSNSSKKGQLTVKATDTSSVVDRLEIDVDIVDYSQGKALMTALHGEPYATVDKKYRVFFLNNLDENISVYQVVGDDRVFVEIEARSMESLSSILKNFLVQSTFTHHWVQSSVFDMFVMKRQPIIQSTHKFFKKFKIS